MMHIGLNLVGDKNWMGGIIYTKNLIHALNSLPEEERREMRITLVAYPNNVEFARQIEPLVEEIYPATVGFRGIKFFPKRLQPLFGKMANPRGFDFLFPVIDPYGYSFPYAAWIPDFQHVHLPELFTRKVLRYRERFFRGIALNSPLVVLSSRMALKDFETLYPECAGRARVLNFASQAEPGYFTADPGQVQRKYHLPDRFFLVSNQFWKHKNHAVVIEALANLKEQGKHPVVVCTGNTEDFRNPDYFDSIVRKVEGQGIAGQFHILGLIPRSDQIQLMRRCLAVIQPSQFEGWSTVVEDARTLGKPVLLSDFPVHLEQNPPGSRYFAPTDAEQLADVMAAAMELLDPGPDLKAEDAARKNNAHSMVDFARNFLAIAKEACDRS